MDIEMIIILLIILGAIFVVEFLIFILKGIFNKGMSALFSGRINDVKQCQSSGGYYSSKYLRCFSKKTPSVKGKCPEPSSLYTKSKGNCHLNLEKVKIEDSVYNRLTL